ncbi:hypothetical protein ACFU8Q_09410 [Streptomyces sp. NPDC057543]|uniref:hypothetical protein n=1 Tax=Streptomyces sp. NPDC057543 TaxID=3346163 RepID=UPI0036A51C9E
MAQPDDQAGVRIEALVAVGRELVRSDPDRAKQLFREAEQIARETADPGRSGWAEATMSLAETDPARCRNIARGITDPNLRRDTLCALAETLALIDARQAAHLAVEPPLTNGADQALAELVRAMVEEAAEHAGRAG